MEARPDRSVVPALLALAALAASLLFPPCEGMRSRRGKRSKRADESSDLAPRERIDALESLGADSFELWKFYEARAERLAAQLWVIGIWLMTLLSALLALPFVAEFIVPTDELPLLAVNSPIATSVVAIAGMLFCVCAYFALGDLRAHIVRQLAQLGDVLEGTWQSSWPSRKAHGWRVLESRRQSLARRLRRPPRPVPLHPPREVIT